MILVEDVIKDVVDSVKMPFTLSNKVAAGSVNTYDIDKTWYINKGLTITIDGGVYKVLEVTKDTSIKLRSFTAPVLAEGDYLLPPPYYTHGKYLAVNSELAAIQDPTKWNPLIWLFRRGRRDRPEDVLSRFESVGEVRLFLMSSSDWANYDTQDHYDNVIKPLTTFVDVFKDALKKQLRINNLSSFRWEFHAKFTTGGDTLAQGDAKNVLPDTQSGIEIIVDIPIRKNYKCF